MGRAAQQRLGMDVGTEPPDLREAALAALRTWRRRGEPDGRTGWADAARAVVRSCEGVLAGLRGVPLVAGKPTFTQPGCMKVAFLQRNPS